MKKYHFKSINSTSKYLKENYQNYNNLTFVSSDFQTNGYGRYNRKWISKKGENILFSILIKDENIIEKYSSLSLASAVCIYELLVELGLDNVSIKWPNDVYVNDKKISGILLEGISNGNTIDALIIGVGLNVNENSFDLPATSIFLETNKKMIIKKIKDNVFKKFEKMLLEIKDNRAYLNIVKSNNYLKNKKVSVKIDNKDVNVEVIDIGEDNSLIVKNGDKILNIYSGEITFHI